MKLQSVIVLLLIAVFLAMAFFLCRYFQKLFRPRESLSQLLLYILSCLLLIFGLTYLMVLLITQLFPKELIK